LTPPPTQWIVLAGLLGLLVGSFLNVAILRLPADMSLVRPRSHCPRCGETLKWYHNIPVVSWLTLRGRCSYCGERISVQYPIVELVTAAIWAGSVYVFGFTPHAAQAVVMMSILLAVAITDGREYVIPDELSLGGVIAGLAMSFLPGSPTPVGSLIGVLVGGGVLWVIAVIGTKMFGEDAMGGGDIKLMAMIGAFVGWQGTLLTLFIGAILATIVFVPINMRSKKLVPFGIFLSIGGAVTFAWGERLLDWYLAGFA
jgi:leader peptidase (prepilin peptidase)/N-methyltransferase